MINANENATNATTAKFQEKVNIGGVNGGVSRELEELYQYITNNPGKRIPEISKTLEMGTVVEKVEKLGKKQEMGRFGFCITKYKWYNKYNNEGRLYLMVKQFATFETTVPVDSVEIENEREKSEN